MVGALLSEALRTNKLTMLSFNVYYGLGIALSLMLTYLLWTCLWVRLLRIIEHLCNFACEKFLKGSVGQAVALQLLDLFQPSQHRVTLFLLQNFLC